MVDVRGRWPAARPRLCDLSRLRHSSDGILPATSVDADSTSLASRGDGSLWPGTLRNRPRCARRRQRGLMETDGEQGVHVLPADTRDTLVAHRRKVGVVEWFAVVPCGASIALRASTNRRRFAGHGSKDSSPEETFWASKFDSQEKWLFSTRRHPAKARGVQKWRSRARVRAASRGILEYSSSNCVPVSLICQLSCSYVAVSRHLDIRFCRL